MSDVTVKFSAEDQNLSKTITNLQRDFERLDVKSKNVSKGFDMSFGKIAGAVSGAYAAVMGFRASFEFVGESIKKASDLAETMNKVNVIFGSSAESVANFASTAVTQLGMTQQEALDGAATFATFGKASGLAGNSLVGFSTNLVQLATDLASFYNTSPAEAIQAIGSALRGESEPIRKYGVLLDEATLKAEAMKLGLYDGKGSLDAQAKSIAAYNAILSQSKDAQGDFSSTSGSLSNQLKIATSSFAELKTEIGQELQPVAKTFVDFLNAEMIPALRDSVKEYKEFAKATHDAAMGNYDTNDAAGKATGGLDLLRTIMVSVIGPINDIVNGTTEFRDQANAAAEAAKKNASGIVDVGKATSAVAPQINKASGELTKAGLEAAAASGQFSGLEENATETGAAINSAFSLNSNFNSAIDAISVAWSDFKSEVTGTSPLLESSYSYADSIAGKIDEQVAGIGNYNKHLEISKNLEELIKNIKTERAEKEKESADKEAERQTDLRTNLQLDLEILKAQISGNEQEERAVQYKKDYNAALKQAIDAGMGQPEAKSFADEIARARQEQAGMNKELSASASLLQKIAQAEAQKGSKIGGLEERGQKQIERGQFQAARRTAERIQGAEVEAGIRGEGKGRDTRSMVDIGKSFGLSRQKDETSSEFAQRVKDVKEGKAQVADKFGRSKPLTEKPGEDGKTKQEMGKDKPMSLESLVLEIKNLVAKIEPKLPQQALAY
jgi:hypothetical protein